MNFLYIFWLFAFLQFLFISFVYFNIFFLMNLLEYSLSKVLNHFFYTLQIFFLCDLPLPYMYFRLKTYFCFYNHIHQPCFFALLFRKLFNHTIRNILLVSFWFQIIGSILKFLFYFIYLSIYSPTETNTIFVLILCMQNLQYHPSAPTSLSCSSA